MITRLKLAAILIFFEVVSKLVLDLIPRENISFSFLGSIFTMSPDIYYIVAGAFSFLILPIFAKVGSYQEVIDVLLLALFVLAFQFIGGLIYHFELPIWIYNGSIKVLLILQFLRLLIIRKNDGVVQDNNFVYLLCRFNPKGSGNLC